MTAADTPALEFAISFSTELGYDNVIVEAAPAGTDDWTTLPEIGGATSTTPPTECEAGFLLDMHPFLPHYLTPGNPCGNDGDERGVERAHRRVGRLAAGRLRPVRVRRGRSTCRSAT